jgi:hypothetical protein
MLETVPGRTFAFFSSAWVGLGEPSRAQLDGSTRLVELEEIRA